MQNRFASLPETYSDTDAHRLANDLNLAEWERQVGLPGFGAWTGEKGLIVHASFIPSATARTGMGLSLANYAYFRS